MFSKEESRQLRELFWTSYGKSFPRKWLLYNTKVKGVTLKFQADRKTASVCIDIEHEDELERLIQFEKFQAIKTILETEYLPEVIFDDNFYLIQSEKYICRIYVKHDEKFSIYNKNTWRAAYEFFNAKMHLLESFFIEYKDFIDPKSL
ncbi:MAG: DUF4268 domain-containing protein [Flavobacteriaceae bacterium]